MVVNDLCILPRAMISLVFEWHDTVVKTRKTTYMYEQSDSDNINTC